MTPKRTFSCTFSNGHSVSITVDMVAFQTAQNIGQCLHMEWEGSKDRRLEVASEYVAWMHTVMCQVASEVQKSFFYAYRLTDTTVCMAFLYKPDGTFEELKP